MSLDYRQFIKSMPLWLWYFLAAFTIIWFSVLDYRHLIPSDEGRYAEIAREMFVSGDWLTPRYNDYKYFEKPPLQAWMTALTYTLFGIGEWQARLWSALTSYFTVFAVGFTAYKLYGKSAGISAALILASAPLWAIAGHFNALDAGLSSFMGLALCSLLLAQRATLTPRAQGNWMLACWSAMALAVLSKGLIGIALPGMVLIAYSVITRDWKLWQRLHIIKGSALFLLIAAPWFVLVSIKNPEFAHFFFIHEHFQRFSTDVHDRTAPFYYFIPILLAGFLPWLGQLPKVITVGWRLPPEKNGFRPATLTLIWIIFIFVFFSISHSKLTGYILPIFPALALLSGLALSQTRLVAWQWQILLLGLLALGGLFSLPRIAAMGANPTEHAAFSAYTGWIALALIIMLVGCISAWWLARNRPLISVITLASSLFLTSMIAGLGHETLGRLSSRIDLAEKIKPLLQDKDRFYSIHTLNHTLPFYLAHTMIMVETADELAFGAQQEPEKFIPTLPQFLERWQQESRAFAIMPESSYMQLRKMGSTMYEVARDRKYIVVTRHDFKNKNCPPFHPC